MITGWKTHTLSVLVEDKPGVLARVAALFSRRGFNIESLAVGPTETASVSRITLVVEVERLPLEQVTKQLNKLINVLKIVELEPAASVQRAVGLTTTISASVRANRRETGREIVACPATTIRSALSPRPAASSSR